MLAVFLFSRGGEGLVPTVSMRIMAALVRLGVVIIGSSRTSRPVASGIVMAGLLLLVVKEGRGIGLLAPCPDG